MNEKLKKQIEFIVELEKLKLIYRQNGVLDNSRSENSAEHSWHIAMMAIVLQNQDSSQKLDILKIIKMLLIHDIVEIDAGDTFIYDDKINNNTANKEKNAAKRIFGLLPKEQENEFLNIWNEFEERRTHEALFAASMDNLQPLLNYLATGKENSHGITKSAVLDGNSFTKSRFISKIRYLKNYKNAFLTDIMSSLGYGLNIDYWGKGYMIESVSAVIDFVYKYTNTNRIQATVTLGNTPSIKLLEKLNFKREGIMRERVYWKDTLKDLYMYSLIKREWES